MNANEIRRTFLEFFTSKQHHIVPSAPMVIKNDPTLMFTNAGMNQFKDLFLGNTPVKFPRVADTQKCLRVSGKHNDLEEVGHDTYHHTMFEMLGNWSFGDYFKKEAIAWGWELLTEVYKLEKDRLYVTVFGGDEGEKLDADEEARGYWKSVIDENRILNGSKKDNFWEMGDTGPCGPCSEIHIDLRDEEERKNVNGRELVNTGHPLVVEIWNLVFIQFNRMADGRLQPLPNKHVDTGMGFERLCMAIQKKKSNYDTDVFQPLIGFIAGMCGRKYGEDPQADVAMRVVADHIRAIAFAIADGQLPSNNKAGYVIRRILRRAVRYGYTFLEFREPFLHKLTGPLEEQMGDQFPELRKQLELIDKVILEEENSFLRTLSTGIQRFDQYIAAGDVKTIGGVFAFELFDTYGFPVDLTQLMAREKNLEVDMKSFDAEMQKQKERSRQAASVETDDWVELKKDVETEFVGYDMMECGTEIVRFRKVKAKNKEQYQIVLAQTPFYAESGGQVGDRGWLISGEEKIEITDTLKENNLIIHLASRLPKDISEAVTARVDETSRLLTMNNHSATHLLHSALRAVLGTHVEQKGSRVDPERLRFDFSHFSKMTEEELENVEKRVNEKIRENIRCEELRSVSMQEATDMGAMALFGEKYGEQVRVIAFDKNYSVELCGGTHVEYTGQIGYFKILSESAIAAGVRRIEAITSQKAEEYIQSELKTLGTLREMLKSPKDLTKTVQGLLDENTTLQKQLEEINRERAKTLAAEWKLKMKEVKGVNFLAQRLDADASLIKDLAFAMKNNTENLFLVIGSAWDDKAGLTVMISEGLVKEKGYNASKIIRELAKEIQGGGGGQDFYATAGGKNTEGIERALTQAEKWLQQNP